MKLFTFSEITKAIDAKWVNAPFEKIAFGSTKRGVTVLYSGKHYDGLHGGFIACADPSATESRLREYAKITYA